MTTPNCESCQSIFRVIGFAGSSDGGQQTFAATLTLAEYEWIAPNGNRVLLCIECTALWRQNAYDDPSLAPIELRLINNHHEITQ